MIETGERTGTLPSALTLLSEYYEEEFDAVCSRLATLIEPVLMILMGVLVGFIALAIITPVYQVTQDLHG
jgi:type IV pilus assembly protein PilC